MRKNELYRHKRSDKIKWTLTAIAFVLLAVLMAGVCMQVFGKGKVQPSEWFKKAGTQTEQTAPDKDGDKEPNAVARISRSALLAENDATGDNVTETLLGTANQPFKVKCGDTELTLTLGSMTGVTTWPVTVTSYSLQASLPGTNGVTSVQKGVRAELSIDLSQAIDQGYTNFQFAAPSGFTIVGTSWEENTYKVNCKSYAVAEANYATAMTFSTWLCQNSNFTCTAAPVPLPADPTKEGYDFSGWYYGTDAEHGENCTAYNGEAIYADTNLHAHFTVKQYTIMLYPENGATATSVKADHFSHLTLTTPEREGYDFIGWTLTDGTIYDATKETVTGAFSLHAKWQIKTFSVTFYLNGAEYRKLTVTYGQTLSSVVAKANAQNLQVMAVRSLSGAPVTNLSDTKVTEDFTMDVQEMKGMEKVKNTVKNHWPTLLLSAGLVVLVIAVICSVVSKKKAYRR